MIIESHKLSGACACGQTHTPTTRLAIIESGCLKDLDDLLAAEGLTGRRAAIYDTNTYQAKGLLRPHADQDIVLGADGLQTDDQAISAVLQQLPADVDLLIAVGTGTIHDITRYCAHKLGLPFISCPTAASGDGFASNACTLFEDGLPTIVPAAAPVLVLADLEVIRRAPLRLARAGIGEAISKFTALADWKTAHILMEKTPCISVESMIRQAAVTAQGTCKTLRALDAGSHAQLMYALLLSGLAVQLQGNTAPARGAEHHLGDLLALLPQPHAQEGLLHGEVAGICSMLVSDLYHRLSTLEDIQPSVKAAKPLEEETLARTFGPAVATRLMAENTPDCLAKVSASRLTAHWAEIRHIVAEIPTSAELSAMLSGCKARKTAEDLGLSDTRIPRLLQLAPVMHNQVTLLRVMRMLKFRYDSKAIASRAPSRSKRYADKAISRAGKRSAVSSSSMR